MGNMTALAGEELGLFARTGQLSLKASEGPVEMQAQNGRMQLFAEKKLTLLFSAPEGVAVTSGEHMQMTATKKRRR